MPGATVDLPSQSFCVGVPDRAASCASQGALDQLTRVLVIELGSRGLRINAVNPTVTLTPMADVAWSDPVKSGSMLAPIARGRFAVPPDVASIVASLLSGAATMIHGATVPVDGGFLAS